MSNILTKQKELQNIQELSAHKQIVSEAAKVILLSIIGMSGRIIFQNIPSVEPLLAIAILASFYGGGRYSLPMALSYSMSNFFMMGGQGPWGIFQSIGVFFACLVASMSRKKGLGPVLVMGAVIFEICTSSSWIFITGINSFILAFIPSLPFSIVHISSTLGFGMVLREGIKRMVGEKSGKQILDGIRSSIASGNNHWSR